MSTTFSPKLSMGFTLLCTLLLSWIGGCGPAPSAGNKSASQKLSPEQAQAAKELSGQGGTAPLTKVSLLLNWYPEAEHGGFYAAQVHGIFQKHGLDVEIKPGGKTTVVREELLLGRVAFGVANADDVLIARNADIPLVALMAPIQDGPRCILTRQDSGIDSFDKLKGIKLQIDSTRPYVPFLKSKGFLQDNVEVVPYFGSVAQLVAEKNVACQGYNFSEPFMARQQGVEVNELMLSTIGYNPYASLLVTTESYLRKNKELCQKMTQACIEGWQKYLESPEESNAIILKNNKQGLEKAALDYGVIALKKLCYPEGEPAVSMGTMTADRWKELGQTLQDLKIIDASVAKPDAAYTTEFLKP